VQSLGTTCVERKHHFHHKQCRYGSTHRRGRPQALALRRSGVERPKVQTLRIEVIIILKFKRQQSKMDKLDALNKRMEELNRIEHDIDYARPTKKPPLPAPVPAAPRTVQNAGAEILGLRKPSTAISARSEIVQT